MNAKTYLDKALLYRENERRLDREIKRIERLLERGQIHPDDKRRKARARLRAMCDRMDSVRADFVEAYTTIIQEISKLDCGKRTDLRVQILMMRYVDGMTFLQIADRLGYAEAYVRSEHGKALGAFQRQFLSKK